MRAVVFVLRGCPAGWLGAYGNEWVATPNLDRLAADSVVFDRHISDRPESAAWSAAALARPEGGTSAVLESLRAAKVPAVLLRANHPDTDGPDWYYAGWAEVFDARPQEEDRSPLDALIRSLPPLLDRLAAVPDYLLWVEIDRLLPPWDVSQDVFDAYFRDEAPEPEWERKENDNDEAGDEDEQQDDEGDAGDVAEADERAEEEDEPAPAEPPTPVPEPSIVPPWSDPPTGPFDTTDPDAWEWLRASFAAVVTALDAELGVVFEQLRDSGLDGSAAWLVTSDFGYPLGEHGQLGPHRPWLHEELVHLPLVLRLPGAAEACRRVPGFSQPPDLAPTLLDLFGLKPADAPSLLALARGSGESHRTSAVTALELNGAAELAIRTEEWALLLPTMVPEDETREPRLFQKPDDRWEVNDLRSRNVERADELEAELRKQVADGHG